ERVNAGSAITLRAARAGRGERRAAEFDPSGDTNRSQRASPQGEKGLAGLACVRWTGRASSCSGPANPYLRGCGRAEARNPWPRGRWSRSLNTELSGGPPRVRSLPEVIDLPAP